MRRLVVAGCLLLAGCGGFWVAPRTTPPPRTQAAPDSVLILLCGVAPGMWAAHADSLDWRTYLTATPQPDSVVVRLVVPGGRRLLVLYRTGGWSK